MFTLTDRCSCNASTPNSCPLTLPHCHFCEATRIFLCANANFFVCCVIVKTMRASLFQYRTACEGHARGQYQFLFTKKGTPLKQFEKSKGVLVNKKPTTGYLALDSTERPEAGGPFSKINHLILLPKVTSFNQGWPKTSSCFDTDLNPNSKPRSRPQPKLPAQH